MPIILWFDDCLLNTYETAWPILEEYGYTGTVSVITGYAGKIWNEINQRSKPLMSIEQMKEMKRAGWDFQSHGVTHTSFIELSTEKAIIELVESKRWMQKNLNITPLCFVLPYTNIAHENIILQYYDYIRVGGNTLWDGHTRTIPTMEMLNNSIKKITLYPFIFYNLLFHSVVSDPKKWEHNPTDFVNIMETIHASEAEVLTFAESIKIIKERVNNNLLDYFKKPIIYNWLKIYFSTYAHIKKHRKRL